MKKEKNRKVKKGAGGRKHSWQYRAISLMCVILLVCSTVILDTGLSRANSFDDEISLDTENVDTVENAALDVSNASKDVTGDAENTMSNARNNINNGIFSSTGTTNTYSATRTATDDGAMRMSSSAWTWIILAIAAIAIIAAVWYYSMQFTNTNRHNNDSQD